MSFTQPKEDKKLEEALVRDFQRGDLEAYDKIANIYQKKIYGLSFNLTRNQMDAQDVTQEVLLTLFRKIHTFQGKSAFSSWVYRITLNASYMKLRSKKKEPNVSIDELMPSFNGAGFQQEKIQDWSESTESLLFTNETRDVIRKAIDLLPEKEKVVFLLRDIEGLSTEKAGEILDLTVPAVKSRLHRARLFLRKKLSSYFEEFSSRKKVEK
jgi:RNA polymerase sigma-70 factor, ECF subfamily